MTLVLLPEGGQQPSASGHQCCSGGNRTANQTGSVKPETYSRGVQTGFSQNPELQQLISGYVCECVTAGEGNCWCKWLGSLKEHDVVKQVLQKGCRSRVAILSSIHEELCRQARGDPVIIPHRRESTHEDPRVRRRRAPPPTLPRPRAQSLIVGSPGPVGSRKGDAHQQQPPPPCQVKPKPKPSPLARENTDRPVSRPSNLSIKPKLKPVTNSTHQKASHAMCLSIQANASNSELANENREGQNVESCTDRKSYVSEAWLFFKGCERGTKVTKNSGMKDKSKMDQTHRRGDDSSDHVSQRLNQQAASAVVSSVATRETSVQPQGREKVNRISGLTCSSITREVQPDNERVSSGNKRKVSHLSGGEGLDDSSLRSAKDSGSDRPSKMGKKDTELENVADVQISASDNNSSELYPQPMENIETSKCLFPTSSNECSRLCEDIPSAKDQSQAMDDNDESDGLSRLKDYDEILECAPTSTETSNPSQRVCISNSEVSGRVEAEILSSHGSTEEKSELLCPVSTNEASSEDADPLCINAFGTADLHFSNCNIPLQRSNSEAKDNISDAESTVRSDVSVMGACAILNSETEHDVDSANKSPLMGDITVRAIATFDRSNEDVCNRSAVESDSDSTTSYVISLPRVMSSPALIQQSDSYSKTEHCIYLLDDELCLGHQDSTRSNLSESRIKPSSEDSVVPKLDVETVHDYHEQEDRDVMMHEKCSAGTKKGDGKSGEATPRRPLNPEKVGILRYLINQSPLVLCDPSESDYEDSDSEGDEPCDIFAVMPYHIVAKIFRWLTTRDLVNLKLACKNFKWVIEYCDIKGLDSRWAEAEEYREDPCMQCGKIRDERGDVSMCQYHPKNYYQNGARHHWACCLQLDENAPGCRYGLHDNNWTTNKAITKSIPKRWRNHRCFHTDGSWADH